ncbi:MAG: thiolase domain-containing protein [Chloroflexi bacterium]|nr:thiolase domain-containing protein [Chloroflexota bacterium]
MRPVSIIGIGQTPVKEHWEKSLRDLAVEAILAALKDAHIENVDALYVGNALSALLGGQEQLGALIADALGMRGVPALKIEAANGAGAGALHVAYSTIAAGIYETVAVIGAEKMTELSNGATTAAISLTGDGDYEAMLGISPTALAALLMRRYMYEYDLVAADMAGFSVNAHANAVANPNAMFPRAITREAYVNAKMISDPINMLDFAPYADGAAALILTASQNLNGNRAASVKIAASTLATDSLSLAARRDPLWLSAAEASAQKAYAHARIAPNDVDLFETHDAYSILSTLQLEAAGFAERGQGALLSRDGEIGVNGKIPVSTRGGLKARGNPVGATGVYQVVEVVEQLRGDAGKNQVANARVGMAQSLGGIGATAVTHVLTN